MPIRKVPDHELTYYLISYDKKGRERSDDPDAPGGRLSDVVLAKLRDEPITDVFFTSHGWKGDVPAAIDQYDRWIGAMAACEEDRQRAREARPAWKSLVVGLHWPSRPWGDEDQPEGGDASFDAAGPVAAPAKSIEDMIEEAAEAIADTPAARRALRTIFDSAMDDTMPARLPDDVRRAYETLVEEAGLSAGGVGAAPGEDAAEFDPEEAYQRELAAGGPDDVSFGVLGSIKSGVLGVARQLSYWKMKKRARTFGEAGAATLLRRMQEEIDRPLRFHLMGHSFGCIAISATLGGKDGGEPLARPVDSVFLAQGAVSFWSYCSDIPVERGTAGYFHPVIEAGKVRGPLVTTQSRHDKAVGKLYPLASQIRGDASFGPGELPEFGALGAFGVRGPGVEIEDVDMKPLDEDYDFDKGHVYNIESSHVINEGSGMSGAHNDIAKPEVAHAFWQAVLGAIK